ncbi:DUF6678 family protein [Arsukibacterium sp.]|uniref:DUF6678 family protein n=1 Tax=Arsukibacterium sp. TaxID=1977258 RepID=UPI002FDB937E
MVDTEARTKARRISKERNLAALANDTKWSEFFAEIHLKSIELEVKFIYVDAPTRPGRIWMPTTNYLEGIQMGPELFVFIEWVRSCDSENVSKIAKHVGLEYFVSEDEITVYGYK